MALLSGGARLAFLLVALVSVATAALEGTSEDASTCGDTLVTDSVRATAMLQASYPRSSPARVVTVKLNSETAHSRDMSLYSAESNTCLPVGLEELHIEAVRHNAARFAAAEGTDEQSLHSKQKPTGETVPLDAAGFKTVTSLCSPTDTDAFFNRLLVSRRLAVCSRPHVQGLMHWFTCVPEMEFQSLLDVIDKGSPCKYWEVEGTTCPALTPECQGEWCR